MKIIIITNDDIPYAGILLYPIIKKFNNQIDSIFIEDGKLIPGDSYFKLLKKIFKISGFRYITFLILESLFYKFSIYFRRFFKLNNYENDQVIEHPSFLGKKFNITTNKIVGSINKNPTLEQIAQISPDLIISIRYAEILKETFLQIPQFGVVNFHPSLLPKYGGIAPMFQGLLNNEPSLGYSLHFIDKKVDTGDILFQESIKFSKNDSVCRLSLKSHIQASIQLKNMVEQFLLMKSFEPILPKEEKSYFSWPTKDQISNFVKSGYHLISLSDFFQLIFYNKEKIIEN